MGPMQVGLQGKRGNNEKENIWRKQLWRHFLENKKLSWISCQGATSPNKLKTVSPLNNFLGTTIWYEVVTDEDITAQG